MKNIVFDLGGVLFARKPETCSAELIELFGFIRVDPMPEFWVDYDRGARSVDEVLDCLVLRSRFPREECERLLRESIALQEPVEPTEALVYDLKRAGYKLYVLSNMSREFISFLRRQRVYGAFDGEVVSCDEGVVKPERAIYDILLDRYGLDPHETLFIDDRRANIAAAEDAGIRGYHFNASDPEASCRELRNMLIKR